MFHPDYFFSEITQWVDRQDRGMKQAWTLRDRIGRWLDLLKQAFSHWSEDKAPRLGAALAYYTVFSIVPLLVVVITIIGLVFGQDAAESYILAQLSGLLGQQSADAIRDMIQRAQHPSTGLVATAVAVITLLFGASGVFGQLQDSLNTIWGVEGEERRGWWGLIRDRFLSFAALLGTGFLLLVSLVVSAILAAGGKWIGGWLSAPDILLQGLNFLLSLGVTAGLFAMMFKTLPEVQIAWSDVWVGAFLTAVLFTIGKFAIAMYLGKSAIGSSYGEAGSLVILLVWVYYSAQILLFGAEFTQVYANAMGSRIVVSADPPVKDGQKAAPRPGSAAGRALPAMQMSDSLTTRLQNASAASAVESIRTTERAKWGGELVLTLSLLRLLRAIPDKRSELR